MPNLSDSRRRNHYIHFIRWRDRCVKSWKWRDLTQLYYWDILSIKGTYSIFWNKKRLSDKLILTFQNSLFPWLCPKKRLLKIANVICVKLSIKNNSKVSCQNWWLFFIENCSLMFWLFDKVVFFIEGVF